MFGWQVLIALSCETAIKRPSTSIRKAKLFSVGLSRFKRLDQACKRDIDADEALKIITIVDRCVRTDKQSLPCIVGIGWKPDGLAIQDCCSAQQGSLRCGRSVLPLPHRSAIRVRADRVQDSIEMSVVVPENKCQHLFGFAPAETGGVSSRTAELRRLRSVIVSGLMPPMCRISVRRLGLAS